ncbi:MAG: transposase family protein [bacterium]
MILLNIILQLFAKHMRSRRFGIGFLVMLLLPAPRFAKDASRAVNRVNNLEIQDVTSASLSQLLDLHGIRVEKFAIEEQAPHAGYLHLFCQHEHDFALCPSCGKIASSGYDHKKRCARHLDIWGKRCFLHFDQRRFDCAVCGKPFTERFSWIDCKRRQTSAFEKHIFQRVEKTNRKHVALEEGLSESTVLDIFKRMARAHVKNIDGRANGFIKALGIDEISLRKGHKQYALLLSDLESRSFGMVAVLENRNKATLIKWLDTLSEQSRRVGIVSNAFQ